MRSNNSLGLQLKKSAFKNVKYLIFGDEEDSCSSLKNRLVSYYL